MLCVLIIICNILFIQIKLKDRCFLISIFKIIVPSNENLFLPLVILKVSCIPRRNYAKLSSHPFVVMRLYNYIRGLCNIFSNTRRGIENTKILSFRVL